MTAPTRNKTSARAATKPSESTGDTEPVAASPEAAGVGTDERPARRRRSTAADETSTRTSSSADEDKPARGRRSAGSRRAAAGTDAAPTAERRFRRSRAGADADAPAERPTRRSRTSADVDAPAERRSRRSRAGADAPAERSRRGNVDARATTVDTAVQPARSRSARVEVSSGEPEVPVRTHGGVADPATAAGTATATVDAPPKPTRTPSIDRPERVTGPSRPRTAAAERAYARRAHRDGHGSVAHAKVSDEDVASGRASFVILIMALLAVGVAATLWLTTQAVADSYRLEDAKEEANRLAEQAAQLQREVTRKESASVLAERARQLGMVPAGDPARIVVGPDGSVTVVGEAKPVQAPAPPPAPAPPADQAAVPPAAQPPAAEAPPAGDAQPPAQQQPPAGDAQPPAAGHTAQGGAAAPVPGGGG